MAANVIILEGLPGTGKSYTLAVLIMLLMIMGMKVLGSAQSNAAVKELKAKVMSVLGQHAPELLETCVHMYSPSREKVYTTALRSNVPEGLRSVPSDCFSKRVLEFAVANPDNQNAIDYRE